MAYEKFNEAWENSPSEATPITAAALDHIEQGLVDVETTPGPKGPEGPEGPQGPAGDTGPAGDAGPAGSDGAEGPKGPAGSKGDAGAKGATGAAGADGDDGFPTETQWDELVARVTALEA